MKYRRKIQLVDALQWDGTLKGAKDIQLEFGSEFFHIIEDQYGFFAVVQTPNGYIRVNKDDFVVNGKNECYPVTPDRFADLYEKV